MPTCANRGAGGSEIGLLSHFGGDKGVHEVEGAGRGRVRRGSARSAPATLPVATGHRLQDRLVEDQSVVCGLQLALVIRSRSRRSRRLRNIAATVRAPRPGHQRRAVGGAGRRSRRKRRWCQQRRRGRGSVLRHPSAALASGVHPSLFAKGGLRDSLLFEVSLPRLHRFLHHELDLEGLVLAEGAAPEQQGTELLRPRDRLPPLEPIRLHLKEAVRADVVVAALSSVERRKI